ncbi:hypothetical protein AAMO2058_000400900 [Amorphochlora amoebiformis]
MDSMQEGVNVLYGMYRQRVCLVCLACLIVTVWSEGMFVKEERTKGMPVNANEEYTKGCFDDNRVVLSHHGHVGRFVPTDLPGTAPGVEVHRATLSDIPSMRTINQKHLKENYRQDWWEEYMLRHPTLTMLLKDGYSNDVIGYILATMRTPERGEIVSLAIDWRWQNKGLGPRLVESCIYVMREKYKAQRVYLFARKNSRPWVVRMYRRLGFTTAAEIDEYFEDGEKALLMGVDLREFGIGRTPFQGNSRSWI